MMNMAGENKNQTPTAKELKDTNKTKKRPQGPGK
jgi:hypothetical protein